jgi:hypothetical protein
MTKWTMRIVFLAVAVGITAAVLLFYGEFAVAMRRAMEVPVVNSEPQSNEVTVTILPAPKPKCEPGKPCPK